MAEDASVAEASCFKPETASEKFSNGSQISIDGVLVSFDSNHDARLEGCAERVKKRRLDWLAMRKLEVFMALVDEVVLLLPLEDSSAIVELPKQLFVGQLAKTALATQARSLALKYLLDRAGFSSRLVSQNRVELIDPRSLTFITLPSTWSESDMQEWLVGADIENFFRVLDLERITANSYSLESRIYKGNFASIYECYFDGRKCAAKVVNVDELDPSKLSSCWRELCLLREVGSPSSCPGIVKYYGYRLEESRPRQLVMFMDKATESVANAVGARAFTVNEMDTVVRHILNGLVYLHQRHVIHRDLKLANCLLMRDSAGDISDVFISDFGLARKRSEVKPWVTKSAGSTRWMAPEVLAGKRSDWRSDIWSFGMIVLELVSRTPPYHNIIVFDVPNLVANKRLPEIAWPSEETLQAPEASKLHRIKAIVKLCLVFDPALRPSALELVKALQAD